MRSRHGHLAGGRQSPTYQAWRHVRQICHDASHPQFHLYGGAGATVAPRWESFDLFLEDMGVRPEGTMPRRIDSSGHFEPGNVAWLPMQKQRRRPSWERIQFFDVVMGLHGWCEVLGHEPATVVRAARRHAHSNKQELLCRNPELGRDLRWLRRVLDP